MEWLSRTALLLGEEKLEKLKKTHVLVAGVGGVGSFAAEMLVRAGIGSLSIVDADVVKPSNRNRQLPALSSTEDKLKVEVMAQRLLDINPQLKIYTHPIFLKDEGIPALLNSANYDYVVDAIDSLTPKVFLIVHTMNKKIPLISSMGAGGKLDPSQVRITDVSKSYNCKLARMLRKRLSKFQLKKGFDVVFSPEEVDKAHVVFVEDEQNKKTTGGTISYMPALFGLLAASQVIRNLSE
ncbi:MAG TPA: tRNA threonylcarbamoyladenosine dehydratase [Bacteroidales bacterium]|nr:tRNA threonylcarbamoyladenosine dehydratase [Bacteroidales bacterium]